MSVRDWQDLVGLSLASLLAVAAVGVVGLLATVSLESEIRPSSVAALAASVALLFVVSRRRGGAA